MAIDAVIFDIGGVLEITPSTGWQNRWAAEVGVGPEELEARLAPVFAAGEIGSISVAEVEAEIVDILGLDEPALADFMDDLWTEYLGTLNEPLVAYFEALRPRYRTATLSNSFVGAREREEALYRLAARCDELVYSHEEGLLKPDPAFYRVACDRLDVAPERCVFVDDQQVSVEGARAVGMRTVRFVENVQTMRDLDQLLGDRRA